MQKPPPVAGGTWPPLNDLPVLARAHGDAPLVLAGQRMLISASAQRGVHDIFVHPHRVCFGTQTGEASEISYTPASLARHIRLGDAHISEHVSVALNEPIAVWCWRADRTATARFAWSVIAGADARTTVDDRTVQIHDTRERTILFAFSEPVEWFVERIDPQSLRVAAELTLPADADAWLAIACPARNEDISACITRIREPARIPTSRAAAFRKRARELIQVAAPDECVTRIVTGLIDRVQTSPIVTCAGVVPVSDSPTSAHPARIDTVDACTIANAAAAIGDSSIPRATLRFLRAIRSSDGGLPGTWSDDRNSAPSSDRAAVAWILLAARYHAWSADDALLRELWPDLCNTARRLPPDRFGHALRAFAITAESLGEAGLAAELRRAPATEPEQPRRSARANVRAAQHLLRLMHDYFGLEPDAPRGRLRASLRIPGRIPRISLSGIRLGDARISIDVNRRADQLRIIADQTAGAIPIRLILETTLSRVPLAIRIDDKPASLDLRPFGNRIVAPVQIELDHARTVDFLFDTQKKPAA